MLLLINTKKQLIVQIKMISLRNNLKKLRIMYNGKKKSHINNLRDTKKPVKIKSQNKPMKQIENYVSIRIRLMVFVLG